MWLRPPIDRRLFPPTPVQPLPHGGYQPDNQPYNRPYNQHYNPAAVAYNHHQRGHHQEEEGEEKEEEEEEEEQQQEAQQLDPYRHHRGPPPHYYQLARGYRYNPSHSEDTELRSPGVAVRFPRDVIAQEEEEEQQEDRLTPPSA